MKVCVETKHIRLKVVGDGDEIKRVYKYLRDGMEVQSIIRNQYMSFLYTAKMNGMPAEELKEKKRAYGRIAGSPKGSPYEYDIKKYPTGLPLVSSAKRAVESKFNEFCKKGLMYGVMSLPTYRKDNPLYVHNDYVNIRGRVRVNTTKNGEKEEKKINTGLYYEYDSPADFLDALYNVRDPELYIAFANNITFRMELGDIKSSYQLREAIEQCFEGIREICDSQIEIKKKKIILLLTTKIEVNEQPDLDENVIVGIDSGLVHPVMCALNTDPDVKYYIGDYEFTEQRFRIQRTLRRLQHSLIYAKGGHGRKKKLKKIDEYHKRERNFARTFNHLVSKRAVEFALKHHAKYINIEDLRGYSKEDRSNFVLRNWSYNELQQLICEKAAQHGIIVRKVAPAYTSQICPVCRHKGIGIKQPDFTCTNPECSCYGVAEDIDFTAARNIAMSTDFTEYGLKILPEEYAEQLKAEYDLVVSQKNIEVVEDFKRNGVLLLKKGNKYYQNLLYRSGTIKILCEDGYYHEFDSYMDLKDYITKRDFNGIKNKLKKESTDEDDYLDEDFDKE